MTYENPNIIDVIAEKLLLDTIITPTYMKRYLSLLGLRGDENILEFGCGAGNCSRWLARNVERGSLLCLDISEFWLNKAKKRLKKYCNVAFRLGDVTKDWPTLGKYDLIFIHQVVHDIPKAQRQEVIGALEHMLGDGGRIFIGEPMKPGHGMAEAEVRGLMASHGLHEEFHTYDKAPLLGESFIGIFSRTP